MAHSQQLNVSFGEGRTTLLYVNCRDVTEDKDRLDSFDYTQLGNYTSKHTAVFVVEPAVFINHFPQVSEPVHFCPAY